MNLFIVNKHQYKNKVISLIIKRVIYDGVVDGLTHPFNKGFNKWSILNPNQTI